MLLDVKNIDVLYDDFQVIWDVSINVNNAEMVALLGPNGSGKSTILNTISNLVHHKNGSIHFENYLISDNVLALDQGKSIAFGSPKEIQNNKQVIDSYLGTFDAA